MPSEEIARAVKIPKNYLNTAVKQLKKAGYIETIRGQGGGHRIVEPADGLSLYDVVNLLEPEKINRCLEADHHCSRHLYGVCSVSRFYELAQRDWDRKLKCMTLKLLASDPSWEELQEALQESKPQNG